MKVFKVKLYYSGERTYEVEAENMDKALDVAIEKLNDDNFMVDNVDDHQVTLADCQYTDQQELQDEEKRYDDKYKSG